MVDFTQLHTSRSLPRVFWTGRSLFALGQMQGCELRIQRPNAPALSVGIFDVNESGLAVQPRGQLRLGAKGLADFYFGETRLAPVKFYVQRLQPEVALLSFADVQDQLQFVLTMSAKDDIITRNWRKMADQDLPPHLRQGVWYHAPFDTNIWMKPSELYVEFEGLGLHQVGEEIHFLKASHRTPEALGYFGPLLHVLPRKVGPGFSWRSRCWRILRTAPMTAFEAERLRAVLEVQ